MNNINFKNLLNLLLVLSVFCLFSCASVGGKKDGVYVQLPKNTSGSSEAEILENISQLQNSEAYLLQPGDLLEVTVFKEDDMSRVARINTNGIITFPLVGIVKVSDCSLAEAEKILTENLKRYFKNPQVSILIKEYANNTVYVLGQVKKPSSLKIPPEKNLTVLEAITSAGGFTDIANTSKVKVLRMENGKQRSIEVDVSQITKQGKKSLDINLMSGDVVFVPQSMF